MRAHGRQRWAARAAFIEASTQTSSQCVTVKPGQTDGACPPRHTIGPEIRTTTVLVDTRTVLPSQVHCEHLQEGQLCATTQADLPGTYGLRHLPGSRCICALNLSPEQGETRAGVRSQLFTNLLPLPVDAGALTQCFLSCKVPGS